MQRAHHRQCSACYDSRKPSLSVPFSLLGPQWTSRRRYSARAVERAQACLAMASQRRIAAPFILAWRARGSSAMVARGRDDGEWARRLVSGTMVWHSVREASRGEGLRGDGFERGGALGMEHVRMRVLGSEAETTATRPAKAAADSMFAGKGSVSDDATYCYWTTCSTCGCSVG